MALYSRILWLCLFSGILTIALLCVRNHGRNLLGSLLHNLRNICLPLLATVLLASGTALAIQQPYMDHEPPLALDDDALTAGGSVALSMGPDEEAESGLLVQRIDADLYYLRNPEYLQMLPEKQQATLNALIFDSCTYAKASLQILKAERLVGGEAEMDRILQELFQNGRTEMPPFITWQDFLDACNVTEDQLIIGGGDIG